MKPYLAATASTASFPLLTGVMPFATLSNISALSRARICCCLAHCAAVMPLGLTSGITLTFVVCETLRPSGPVQRANHVFFRLYIVAITSSVSFLLHIFYHSSLKTARTRRTPLGKEIPHPPMEHNGVECRSGSTLAIRMGSGFAGLESVRGSVHESVREGVHESVRFGVHGSVRSALRPIAPHSREPLKNKEPFALVEEDKRCLARGGSGI